MNLVKLSTMAIALSFVAVTSVQAIGPSKLLGEMPEKAGSRPGLLKKTFELKGKAAIGTCTVTGISGTTITCTKDGKTFTVLTDDKTQFRRKFWGKSSLSEIHNGDVVNVIGLWTDDSHTTIQAHLIRDTSIQKRFGVFFGTVTSLTADGWVMDTLRRGSQTVTVGSDTKFVNRREQAITKTDIAVGHRVRVKGLWDSKLSTITEVKQVKDFSLPPKASGTPTPTPTP